ncbi:uncharacterized protein [Dysidea avara]|uniref:uncharacterized protein n=1 Tax=Dysidea avara TaxID=196820 RepID=UPI0033237BF5
MAEMYLQIKLYPQDRPSHRFLWRNLSLEEDIKEYEFDRLVFSPFLAQLVTQHHAKIYQERYPEIILKSTYMDDNMTSVVSEDQGVQLYQELSDLWARAGIHAHKWLSNSDVVLSQIPVKDRIYEIDLNSDPLPSVKTLGVMWLATEDVFMFNSKMMEQRELSSLPSVRIPRCLQLRKEVSSIAVHVFVDASLEAYGAVVYVRVKYQDGSLSVRLVSSKTKVAPLQSVSVPRLDLMGAVLGSRLATSIQML